MSENLEFYHEPIMLNEIVEGLNLKPFSIVVDCTLGGAGHSFEILKFIPNGKLIGIDKDVEAINYSQNRLSKYSNVVFVRNDFKNYKSILSKLKIKKVDAILIDLGVSSHQIDTPSRGFSFRFDAPLDMRMDTSQKLTAKFVVNNYSKSELIKILKIYGEEKFASLIVSNIIKHRLIKPIETTFELKNIIEECLPKKIIYKSNGASKKTFQALRIEVNSELFGLESAIQDMIDSLNPKGRLAVLSFHSLEDRIVKNIFKYNATGCICPPNIPLCVCNHKASVKIITKKPLTASNLEQTNNPRSTSAKLRIIEKL